MTIPTIKVALLDLGERLQINLPLLALKLNSLQSAFRFETVDPVTLEAMGDPDVDNQFYSVQALFPLLQSHHDFENFKFVVGITDLKVTDSEDLESKERAYFSKSNLSKASIISANKALLTFKSPLKTEYQYVSYLLMGELLINLARRYLEHLTPQACLFDDCEDRASLRECIEMGEICVVCRAELKKRNVSNRIIDEVNEVLRWCKKNSFAITLRHTVNDQWFMLIAGIVFALPAGWLITNGWYKTFAVVILLAVSTIFFIWRSAK
jgi:uncharacterized membrane protein